MAWISRIFTLTYRNLKSLERNLVLNLKPKLLSIRTSGAPLQTGGGLTEFLEAPSLCQYCLLGQRGMVYGVLASATPAGSPAGESSAKSHTGFLNRFETVLVQSPCTVDHHPAEVWS